MMRGRLSPLTLLLVVLLCAGLLPSSCAFAIGGGRAKAPNLNILWRNADVLGRTLARRRISSTTTTSLRAASLEEATLHQPSTADTNTGDGTTTFAAPALFTAADSRPVVLFDGKCNLCSWGVQLMLDYDSCTTDSRGNLRLAALQSRVGALLLARLDERTRGQVLRSASDGGGGGDQFKSIVVCGPDRTWTNTAAALKMGRSMRFPFRPLALLAWFIPPFLRNLCYRGLSRNRKRLFGERDECRLWDDRWDTRFVDDSLLGGEGSQGSDDPLADPNSPPSKGADDEDDATVVVAEDVQKGDRVRITSPEPVVVHHAEAFPDGVCVSGCAGVVEVVNANNLVVQFDLGGEEGQFQAYVGKEQVTKIQ